MLIGRDWTNILINRSETENRMVCDDYGWNRNPHGVRRLRMKQKSAWCATITVWIFVEISRSRCWSWCWSMLIQMLIQLNLDVDPTCCAKRKCVVQDVEPKCCAKSQMLIVMLIHHVESKRRCWSRCWSKMLCQK